MKKEAKLQQALLQVPEAIGSQTLGVIKTLGKIGFLLVEAFICLFKPPLRWRLYLKQLEFIGNKSLSVIILTGLAIGAILTLQMTHTLRAFSSENMVGGIVALVMSREMGPLLGALMINGRVASAIAAEIGTMRVTEQIAALESMAVDPIQYLITPRIFAGFFILPFMTMVMNMVAMVASYIIGVQLLGLDVGVFFSKIEVFVDAEEILKGLAKSSIFGIILTSVGCYKGYYTSGGAEGVGVSTTQAVVVGSVLMMIADYIIGAFLL